MSGPGCVAAGGLAKCSTAAATGANCSLNRRDASQQVSAMAMNPSHMPSAILPVRYKALSRIGKDRRGVGR
ncbi:hypothetical protein D3C80_1730870 [compost metagenome]